MNPEHDENPTNRASQNGKAKSVKAQMASRIARLVRAAGLDYEAWRVCQPSGSQQVRPAPAEEAEETPPRPEPRRVQEVL